MKYIQYMRGGGGVSTSGISWVHWGVYSTSEEYYEYIGGTSWFMWESKLIKVFDLYWKPQCTEHLPMYSWYPPTWIIISSYLHHGNPPMYWTSPDVLMISPNALMVSPNVLNTPPPPPLINWTHITRDGSTAARVICRSNKKENTQEKLCFTWLAQCLLWFTSKSLFIM